MTEPYTGDLGGRGVLRNSVLSEKPGGIRYLCSGAATYIGSGKEIKGRNTEDRRT